MISQQIQCGDQLRENDALVYEVEGVYNNGVTVTCAVRYRDGGDGLREFDIDQDVPLVRGAR